MWLLKFDIVKVGLLVMLGMACSDSKKKDEIIMAEAISIHNEAVEWSERIDRKLDILEQQPGAAILLDSIRDIKVALFEWENDLVEVPGNKVAHKHKEETHHHHDDQPQLTPEQMLAIQEELLKRLEKMEERINSWSTKN
jgi:hypothetical protein